MHATIPRIGAEVKRRLSYIEATSYFVYPQGVTKSSCLERSDPKVLVERGFPEW
jgi:hypothetical protein